MKTLMKNYNAAVNNAQAIYFTTLITQNAPTHKVLFKKIDQIVGTNTYLLASSDLCQQLKIFFTDKIENIRSLTDAGPKTDLSQSL